MTPFAAEQLQKREEYKILSIDGAGIYGLVSAIWLRKLCERDKNFLSGTDIQLFSGISAGAVTALLLARHKCPRDAVLAGELERFWTEPLGAFSHELDPVKAWLSLFGVGSWFGTEDFLHQLRRYFGDMTLGDLPQRVHISTFNWMADEDGGASPNSWNSTELADRSWEPRFFTNLPEDSDARSRVVDVAYGACAPAGLRAIRGGIGDAATFAISPALETIASVILALKTQEKERGKKVPPVGLDSSGNEREQPRAGAEKDQVDPKEQSTISAPNTDIVNRAYSEENPVSPIALLSVGNGSVAPFFHQRDFDLSLAQMAMHPTNPGMGHFFPPATYAQFDGLVAHAHYVSLMLLGRRYFRLDLNLMPVPVTLATMLARFPLWRQFFIQQIQYLTASERSETVVRRTLDFLKDNWTVPLKNQASGSNRTGIYNGRFSQGE